jgi:hypothetical protein
MGRLPSKYAGLEVQGRFPYVMDSELTLAASLSTQPFPGSDFLNEQDKVFEVHRMIPRIWALDDNGLLLLTQPAMETLEGLVLLSMNLLGFNQLVTKSPSRVGVLVKGSSERTWEYAEPFYLPNGRAIQLFANTVAFPAAATYTQLLIAVSFEGFLLQLAPAQG